MFLRIALFCVMPVLMLAGRADALSVTRPVTFTPTGSGGFFGTFDKFDPTLGAFDAATLDFTLTYAGPQSKFIIESNALFGSEWAATFSDTRTVIRESRWPFLIRTGPTPQTFVGRGTVSAAQATGSGSGRVNIFTFSPGTITAADDTMISIANFISMSGTISYSYTPAPTPIPVPGGLALLAPVVMGVALLRRRVVHGARKPGFAA